jgi:hypothetical protein
MREIMPKEKRLAVNKAKFDAVLRVLINAPPTTFKEVVARPKPRKDGDVKRSAKKRVVG